MCYIGTTCRGTGRCLGLRKMSEQGLGMGLPEAAVAAEVQEERRHKRKRKESIWGPLWVDGRMG
jgi:hypothetical protein